MKTRKRIAFIEYDADNRAMIQSAFKQVDCPHQTEGFADATTFFEHLDISHIRPDLLLLDHHLPHTDGVRVLRTLKINPDWRTIPVVIWSSQMSIQNIHDYYESGANSCIQKSLERAALVSQVELICSYWFEVAHLPSNSVLGAY